jgi:hypothetical protein
MHALHSCKMQIIKVYTSEMDSTEHHLALQNYCHDNRDLVSPPALTLRKK